MFNNTYKYGLKWVKNKIVGTKERNDNKKEGKQNTVETFKVFKINKYAKIKKLRMFSNNYSKIKNLCIHSFI